MRRDKNHNNFCCSELISYLCGVFSASLNSTYRQVGKFSEFMLRLKGMPEGNHHFDYHLDKQFFEDMENADVRDADLSVKLDIYHQHGGYDLTFAVKGVITLMCDRCLDNLEWPVDTTYHVRVEYGDSYRDESDDLLIIPEGDDTLDVAYMLHDTVALTIPIRHVHPQGQCNRKMAAALRQHRAHRPGDEDTELEDALMDEMDDMSADNSVPDSRWDALRDVRAKAEETEGTATDNK